MPSTIITEADVENAALDWFRELGYQFAYGPDISHDGANPERTSHRDVVLMDRLRAAITTCRAWWPAISTFMPS